MTSQTNEKVDGRGTVAVLAAFAFACAFCVNLFPREPGGELAQSPNELSRYELVVSIAERGSLSIGPELARFGDHEDKAVYQGRYYSNKAPGLSLAVVPVYGVVRLFTGAARPDNATTVFYLVRLLTVSLTVVVALAFLAQRLARNGAGAWTAPILFAAAFGTPLLLYARTFFSHAWTAALLYLAFEYLHRPTEKAWHPALAGFLAGWAVLSEYPAGILAACLLVDAGWRKPARRTVVFLAGALPAAIILGLYDAACFAGPFDLSSAHEWYRPFARLSRGTAFGFLLPSPKTAFLFLFSPSRGIFFQSPFLLFLPWAFARGWKERAVRVSAGAAVALFVVMCAYENWHGGWALSARYLVPILFFLLWPLAFTVRETKYGRVLFGAAVVYSALFFLWSTSTYWFYPADPWNAPRFYTAWFLAHGWFAPTLAGSTLVGVLVLAAATGVSGFAAFRQFFRSRREAILVILAGTAAFALIFAGPSPRGSFGERLTRVRMFEGFTHLDPGRAELLRLRSEVQTETDRRSWEQSVMRAGIRP